ncbi:sulfotransferase 2A1-like [Acomys russatus]|uniref:sulfotransferase 2A1-like n=1 Tax=Acomys russatus TaxID=60746 RepID=UPI0021E2D820|nr:sulfotransferase 2A1-like [Acomys russatus]
MSDNYDWVEEVPIPSKWVSAEMVRELRDTFVVRDEDLYMMTYPKSGTNWLVEIVCLIHSKGDPTWIKTLSIDKRVPWIEIGECSRELKNKEDPRLITSHLPVQLFPKSFFCSKAKMIYLLRNPRDALVSGYYFLCALNYIKKSESLEGFFKDFIQGNGIVGDWKDHFTVAQAEEFDKIFEEKMADFPKELFPWE